MGPRIMGLETKFTPPIMLIPLPFTEGSFETPLQPRSALNPVTGKLLYTVGISSWGERQRKRESLATSTVSEEQSRPCKSAK